MAKSMKDKHTGSVNGQRGELESVVIGGYNKTKCSATLYQAECNTFSALLREGQ